MDALQYHADQAFIAHQLSEASNARARTVRTRLVDRIRRLYETDHHQAAAAAYTVDAATALAIQGLLDNVAPMSTEGFEFPIDRLLLHADPAAFDHVLPTFSASRAVLAAERPSSPEEGAPSSSSLPLEPEDTVAAAPDPSEPLSGEEEEEEGDDPSALLPVLSPGADPIEGSDDVGSDGD